MDSRLESLVDQITVEASEDAFDFMGTVVAEWAYENGVTVILIEDENVVGAMIGLDGEMASKVTVGRSC